MIAAFLAKEYGPPLLFLTIHQTLLPELSCSGEAPPTDENKVPSAHGSTGSPRAVGIPFVLRLSKGEQAIFRAANTRVKPAEFEYAGMGGAP